MTNQSETGCEERDDVQGFVGPSLVGVGIYQQLVLRELVVRVLDAVGGTRPSR